MKKIESAGNLICRQPIRRARPSTYRSASPACWRSRPALRPARAVSLTVGVDGGDRHPHECSPSGSVVGMPRRASDASALGFAKAMRPPRPVSRGFRARRHHRGRSALCASSPRRRGQSLAHGQVLVAHAEHGLDGLAVAALRNPRRAVTSDPTRVRPQEALRRPGRRTASSAQLSRSLRWFQIDRLSLLSSFVNA